MILSGMPRGIPFEFYTTLHAAGSAAFQANPTLAAGDVKISKDGAAEANIGTLPTVSPAAGKQVKVSLSATEMTATVVMVRFEDVAGAEWDEEAFWLHTTPVPASVVNTGAIAPSTSTFGSDLAGYENGELEDAYVLFLTGDNAGTSRPVTDYTSANGQFTFTSPKIWENIPASGDRFIVIGSKQ